MNDYRELVEKLRMAGRWIKHDDGSEETYLLSVSDCVKIADAIEQLVKERDAAIEDMETIANNMLLGCEFCKKNCTEQSNCLTGDARFEWRGVQE